jgi:Domain of unknown function (DUF389)
MSGLTNADIARMRDQLFFEGPERNRRLSRYWLLLPLAAVIASAGVVSDSTATVIGAMIVAPLMTPILGIVLAVVLADGPNLRLCLLLLVAGAVAVAGIGWLMGLFVPYPVVAATNSQVAARAPRIVDLVAALAVVGLTLESGAPAIPWALSCCSPPTSLPSWPAASWLWPSTGCTGSSASQAPAIAAPSSSSPPSCSW